MNDSSDFENINLVLKYVYDMYSNPDGSVKDKASKWLADFQKSVSFLFIFPCENFHSFSWIS